MMTGTTTTEIRYQLLPGSLNGLYDHQTDTVIIDPRCDLPTRRSTLAHELIHAERGDAACHDEWFSAKQELTVERQAALRLISVEDLIEGIRMANDDHHLAEWLEVDIDMLYTRLHLLNSEQLDAIEAAVERLERTA